MLQRSILATAVLLSSSLHAQVNGYAQVTNISDNVCTIGASNEAASSFTVGKQVVIMQMQDDVIGENLFNNASFGDIGHAASAGEFSIREIISVERSGGLLTSVTLDEGPGALFNFGMNTSVQLITYELLGNGGDFTTTSNIGAISWNGTLGGVIAFHVQGTLNLEHNITADVAGFRGGTRTTSSEGTCDPDEYVYDVSGTDATMYAGKGEGVYKNTTSAWGKGRGHILNGGGGGNSNNGGGGGGSNLTTGGMGGAGFGCAVNASGGLGGVDLSGHVSSARLFMGGGGGGGEGNSNSSSVGMRGGGIIMIKANMLKTNGSCGGRSISANGGNGNPSGSDGAGGGGGGGSILLHVDVFDISANCPITIRANGGNGGNVNDATDHGGGGGGGQGAVLFKGMVPIGNITVQTNNGIGGCNNNSVPCNSQAGNGGGANGAGILYYDASPLPVELLAFNAIPAEGMVDLLWSTATEKENELFIIERSSDGILWAPIHRTLGAGESTTRHDYSARDEQPLPGNSYYRLAQLASGGETTYSQTVPVHMKSLANDQMILYPNPASDRVIVMLDGTSPITELRIYNELGQMVTPLIRITSTTTAVDISGLIPGIYVAMLTGSGPPKVRKLVINR